jgi:hypothetical protein
MLAGPRNCATVPQPELDFGFKMAKSCGHSLSREAQLLLDFEIKMDTVSRTWQGSCDINIYIYTVQ